MKKASLPGANSVFTECYEKIKKLYERTRKSDSFSTPEEILRDVQKYCPYSIHQFAYASWSDAMNQMRKDLGIYQPKTRAKRKVS